MLVLVMLGILFGGTLGTKGRAQNEMRGRVAWAAVCLCVVMAMALTNPWAGALVLVMMLGLFRNGDPMSLAVNTVYPVLAYVAVYAALSASAERWMVAPLLYGLVVIGMLTGAWALYSKRQPGTYERQIWRSLIVFDKWGDPIAGQGNHNFTQSLAALSIGALAGLLVLGHWWAAIALPLLAVPLWLCQRAGTGVGQGTFHVIALALGLIALLDDRWGVGAVLALLVGVVIWAQPWKPRETWWDSGRFLLWRDAIAQIWWPVLRIPDLGQLEYHLGRTIHNLEQQAQLPGPSFMRVSNGASETFITGDIARAVLQMKREELAVVRLVKDYLAGKPQTLSQQQRALEELQEKDQWDRWRVRLLGYGTSTFLATTVQWTMARTKRFFTHAHSEYVQQLIEHGIIGVIVLLAFLVNLLWRTLHGGPEGHALFLLGVMLCSIAAMTCPWRHYDELEVSDGVFRTGTPTFLVISLLVASLAELF